MNTYPTTQFFVGYQTLEKWLAAINREEPVFAALTTEPGKPDGHQLRIDTVLILVAQPGAEGLLHYCRLVLGELRYMDDRPFDIDHIQRLAKAEQTWNQVQEWLASKHLNVIEGVIGLPLNIRPQNGSVHFL